MQDPVMGSLQPNIEALSLLEDGDPQPKENLG